MTYEAWPNPIRIVLYDNHEDRYPKPAEMSPEQFLSFILEHQRTDCNPCPGNKCKKKFGDAFSAGIIAPPKTRLDTNVIEVTLAVFDFDGVKWPDFEAATANLEGYEAVIYSTHSHSLGLPKFRLVMPLSRPVKPKSEWPRFWAECVRRFGIEKLVDHSGKNCSRLFFFPTSPKDAEVIALREEGKPIDVDEFLKAAKVASLSRLGPYSQTVGARIEPETPTVNTDGSIDLEQMRRQLVHYRKPEKPETEEAIRRVRKGESISEVGNRDNTINAVAGVLAWEFSDAPEEAVRELIRPAVFAMPLQEGEDHEKWLDATMEKFQRALGRRAAKLQEEAESLRRLKKHLGFREVVPELTANSESPQPVAAPSAQSAAQPAAEEATAKDENFNWVELLTETETKNGEKKISNDGVNIAVYLEHSPEWKNVLRFNQIKKTIDVFGGPLSGAHRRVGPSEIPTAVNNWFRQAIGVSVPDHVARAQMAMIAKTNGYNPLQQYLRGLQWDGVPRIDFFFERYFGVKTIDNDGENITSYVRLVSRRWLVGAIARALDPGCKMDNVPVLEGGQGARKSTALGILGGEFFAELHLDVSNKDTKQLAGVNWVIELPELASFRKSETEAQKAFFSTQVDKFRPPYGAAIEEFPRQCVFVGTTNDETYLIDPTGNRRYWPLRCGKEVDVLSLQQDKDQNLAEAVVLFMVGWERFQTGTPKLLAWEDQERWWFSSDEAHIVEAQTAKRERDRESPMREIIWRWWLGMEPSQRPSLVKASGVATGALAMTPDKIDHRIALAIGLVLTRLGFEKKRVREHGADFTVFEAPEALRRLPKYSGTGPVLTPIDGQKTEQKTQP